MTTKPKKNVKSKKATPVKKSKATQTIKNDSKPKKTLKKKKGFTLVELLAVLG